MNYNKKAAFFACCLGIFLFGAGITTLGSILPYVREQLDIDDLKAGTLFSILPFGILTGSLIFGPVCDRFGYKLLLICCCLFMAVGFGGIAFSTSIAFLQVAAFVFGVGGGAMNGATSAAVADMSRESKGGNLSLLGLFFGVGAWTMPVVIGSLNEMYSFRQIIGFAGVISLSTAAAYLFIGFPPPKQQHDFSLPVVWGMMKDRFLILIAFFLFCQSSFEAVINNWSPSYLIASKGIAQKLSVYALSFYVAGYTIMRLLLASVFRNMAELKLQFISLGFVLSGWVLLSFVDSFELSAMALALIGIGLSGGFPLMLSLVGKKFAAISGTAFSFVFVIALAGNMIVNYFVGVIADTVGLHHISTVIIAETAVMFLLLMFISRSFKGKV